MEERERTSIPGAGEGADEELAKGVASRRRRGQRKPSEGRRHSPARHCRHSSLPRKGERERTGVEYGTKDKSRGRKPRVLLIFF
jgi:hypothetical protein